MPEPTSAATPRLRSHFCQKLDSGEVLVYCTDNETVLCLNPAAALVLGLCDGTASLQRIIDAVEDQTASEVAEPIVLTALQQFQDHGLLESSLPPAAEAACASRRGFLKSMGCAALATPLVMSSMLVPRPVQAVSVQCVSPRCSSCNDWPHWWGYCYSSNDCTGSSKICPCSSPYPCNPTNCSQSWTTGCCKFVPGYGYLWTCDCCYTKGHGDSWQPVLQH